MAKCCKACHRKVVLGFQFYHCDKHGDLTLDEVYDAVELEIQQEPAKGEWEEDTEPMWTQQWPKP